MSETKTMNATEARPLPGGFAPPPDPPSPPIVPRERQRVRLLPLVVTAAAGLLLLKLTGLATTGGYIFPAAEPPKPIVSEKDLPAFGRAIARARFNPPQDEAPDTTGAVPAKKTEKPEDKPATPPRQELAQSRPSTPPPPISASEKAILERLQERRGVVEDRDRELEMRENLLKAAEKKLGDRIDELKDAESKVDASTKARDAQEQAQIKSLVTMYETMKPKEAARVFDRLDLRILVPVVIQMNPRKMAEVMAAMSPEAAEKLTVALATRGTERASPLPAAASSLPPGELQRIDQPPARR